MFSSCICTPRRITTGMPPIVSTTSVSFFLFVLPCLIGLSAKVTDRCLPGKEDQIKQDYMHRSVSSCIACPPVISATGNSFANDHSSTRFHVYVCIKMQRRGGAIFYPQQPRPSFHDGPAPVVWIGGSLAYQGKT